MKIPLPTLHQAQKEVKNNLKRHSVVICGRRFGKTLMCIRETAIAAINGQKVAYIAPNFSTVSYYWKEVQRRLKDLIKSQNTKDHVMELMTGGIIYGFSMEAIANIRGKSLDLVYVDEAGYCSNLEYEFDSAIRPTLIDRKGKSVFISTPNGFNDLYNLSERQHKQKEWTTIQMPTWMNPYMPQEEIDSLKESLPSHIYNAEIGAQFVDMKQGLFKKDWIEKVSQDQIPKDLAITFGIDLAISKASSADYTVVAVLGHHAPTSKYYVLAVHRSRMSFDEMKLRIQQMAEEWNPISIAMEANSFQRIVAEDLMNNTTLPIVPVQTLTDKYTRALPFAAKMENGYILFSDSKAVDEEVYNEIIQFPNPKLHDDTIDALGFALNCHSVPKPFIFSI